MDIGNGLIMRSGTVAWRCGAQSELATALTAAERLTWASKE